MPKRIYWKKGMRLTDEILKLSDNCTDKLISNALLVSLGKRFGLFPDTKPFNLSVDINKNIIDIVTINCHGVTQDGTLIDVAYGTDYTNSFDTRVTIPSTDEEVKYLLCIKATNDWIEMNNGFAEILYGFILIEENTPVPSDSLPISRIVFDECCWRIDDIDFLPPCIFISALNQYEELAQEFHQILIKLDKIVPTNFLTDSKDALKIFWPVVQQLQITMDKEMDVMSPMNLFANIQKCISSFVCACTLDDFINLSEAGKYIDYIRSPYTIKDVYPKIKYGLELCNLVIGKIEGFDSIESNDSRVKVDAPYIDRSQLRQTIKSGNARIKIENKTTGAQIYYTIDGTNPNQSSMSGSTIIINSGFTDNWHKEPPKNITIKVMAVKDGVSSIIETFDAQIRKGNPFEGKQI